MVMLMRLVLNSSPDLGANVAVGFRCVGILFETEPTSC